MPYEPDDLDRALIEKASAALKRDRISDLDHDDIADLIRLVRSFSAADNPDRAAVAAEMAGAWWADRLPRQYAEFRPALAEAIEGRVLMALRGEMAWSPGGARSREDGKPLEYVDTSVDYGPEGLLREALQEVLGFLLPWEAIKDLLPHKHALRVTLEYLEPKEGYAKVMPRIPVPK